MNATKRKFNALLQGIGSRSSTDKSSSRPSSAIFDSSTRTNDMFPSSTTPLSSDFDLLNKRRRVGQLGPNGLKDAPAATSAGTTISNVVLRKWSGTHDKSAKAAPRYCPGDRDELIKRLATFQELTDWTPKPDRVNEIEWAKRGWVCHGKERLRCTLCSKEIVVKLNRKEVDGKEVPVLIASEIEEALVEKYAELITTSHQDDCLWRKKGCDDSLLRLSIANPKTALEGLRQRYDELCARKDFLPYEFNLRLPDGLDIDAVLKNLPTTFFSDPPPAVLTSSSAPNRTALALAMIGWQGLTNSRIGPVPNSASCHTCLRRLGLWMFKSKEVDTETNTILVPAPMDHLEPVREHRFFCPWRDGTVQRNPGGGTRPRSRAAGDEADMPAWQVLVQVIKNDAYLRNRSSTYSRPGTRQGQRDTIIETNTRPGTAATQAESMLGDGGEMEVDEVARAAKDKERWARLRKVKSLFDTKGGKKLKRAVSRPGTGHSSIRPGTGTGTGEQT